MQVVSCNSFGPIANLTLEDRPSQPIAPGLVRIAVTAAGVNFVDALFVQGLYQIKPPTPFVPGGEIAGVVTEVGEGVTTHAVGDRVFASTGLGGFTSELVWPAKRVWHTPSALTDMSRRQSASGPRYSPARLAPAPGSYVREGA